MLASHLTLRDAIRDDRLSEFIAQEEARGVGPTDLQKFADALETTIKQPQSEDQTSRSASRDGSRGK